MRTKNKNGDSKYVPFYTHVKPEHKRELKLRAKRERKSVAQLTRELLDLHL